jgi:hypothetical protein
MAAMMTSWVCNRDGVEFPVGLPQCPELSCQARDAHEKGGDRSVNVYGLAGEDDEVGARLGLVPGDPGAEDPSTDPEPVMGEGVAALADGSVTEVELTGDGAGTALPDAVEGDTTERVDDRSESPGSAPGRTRAKKDVRS